MSHGNTKHGASGTVEYRIWAGMKRRCGNPSHTYYQNYGARGIKVLYTSFEVFLADVGLRPRPEYSMPRVPVPAVYP